MPLRLGLLICLFILATIPTSMGTMRFAEVESIIRGFTNAIHRLLEVILAPDVRVLLKKVLTVQNSEHMKGYLSACQLPCWVIHLGQSTQAWSTLLTSTLIYHHTKIHLPLQSMEYSRWILEAAKTSKQLLFTRLEQIGCWHLETLQSPLIILQFKLLPIVPERRF